MKLLNEKYVRIAFEASLWIKGIFALIEIGGGIAAYFVTQRLLVEIASAVTQGELTEDPHDLIANYLFRSAQNLSIGAQHFTAFYLFSHGAIKLWLIVGLLRERLWYYPTAMVVFGLFIIYQLYRFSSTHSLLLLLITAVDAVVIALTWHEYRYLHRRTQRVSPPSGS
jgi:uncharacterized membrane protein